MQSTPTSERITAKWKTSIEAGEEHVGTIDFDEDFNLNFPILTSRESLPAGANTFWGLTNKLEKCTALTSSFRNYTTVTGQNGELFSAEVFIDRLLVGKNYIADPASAFVREIIFTPYPNKQLYVRGIFEIIQPSRDIAKIEFVPSCNTNSKDFAAANLAYFQAAREAIFETKITSSDTTVSAWIGGSHSLGLEGNVQSRIIFKITFNAPCTLEAASDEAAQMCAFLSFITHQYVYPTDFHIKAMDEDEAYRFYHAGIRSKTNDEKRWVGYTLILPEKNPAEFGTLLQKWYAVNDKNLRSRYLYRYSLEKPHSFSQDRFLAVFQAIEGIIPKSGYQLLANEELKAVEDKLRDSFPSMKKLDALTKKFRSGNRESLEYILKQELPKLFAASRLAPKFDVNEFIERVYRCRNLYSHGGRHSASILSKTMIDDTLLLTAIYLILECSGLRLNVHDALNKFRGALWHLDLPFDLVVNG